MGEDIVAEIYRLFNDDVVLIPVPLGKKAPRGKRWQKATLTQSKGKFYQWRLRQGNIGVLMIDGLVAIDCDCEALRTDLLVLNPWLSDTLQTRGNRAGTFWLRIKGAYPASVVKLKDSRQTPALDVGECRGAGQTIIHGKHPAGAMYQFVSRVPPMRIEFSQIKWPDWVNVPRVKDEASPLMQHSNTVTQSPRDTVTQLHSHPVDTETHVVSGCAGVWVDVALFLPTAFDQNHGLLFIMARAILAEEIKLGRQATAQELMATFKDWYAANSFLDPTNSFDDYWLEFQRAMDNAKVPLGTNTLTYAIVLASKEPLPEVALQFNDSAKQKLVAVLYQMQILTYPKPFYITCRDAAAIEGVNIDHVTASRWLNAFCAERTGFLILVKRGSQATREGSEYKFESLR